MRVSRSITDLARDLRKKSTQAEKLLWQEVRNRKLMGVKFFRQHPVIYEEDRKQMHFFIADFYSSEQKLVMELDGKIHDYQVDYDRERDLILAKLDLKVVRFRNEETQQMDKLLMKISSCFH
jgi:very-short-patch-repair endonuclease